MIELPVLTAGVMNLVDFTVVNQLAPYNAIFGTPLLYSMRTNPSTYHQRIKFPSTGEGGSYT